MNQPFVCKVLRKITRIQGHHSYLSDPSNASLSGIKKASYCFFMTMHESYLAIAINNDNDNSYFT